MNTTAASSIPDPVAVPDKTATARCPYIYSNGKRCSLPGSSAHSGFCRRHSPDSLPVATPAPFQNDSEDLSADLLPELSEFSAGTDIRQFLGRLLTLVTKGRISPRRASVLVHISSLLLRTLPAIDYDNEHYTYDDEETEEQAVAESAANPAPQPVPPGKEPLPKTAEEFAAAVLDRKPN